MRTNNASYRGAAVAAAVGAVVGSAFVLAFEELCWGDEHVGSEYRHPPDADIRNDRGVGGGNALSPQLLLPMIPRLAEPIGPTSASE